MEMRVHIAQLTFDTAFRHVREFGHQLLLDPDTKSIENALAMLKEPEKELNHRIDILKHQRLQQTQRNMDANLRETKARRLVQSQMDLKMNDGFATMANVQQAINERLQANDEKSEQRFAKFSLDLKAMLERHGQRQESITNVLWMMFSEMIYERQEIQRSYSAGRLVDYGPQRLMLVPINPVPMLSTQELSDILSTDPQISMVDKEQILRDSHSMLPKALAHVSGLMAAPAFKNWLNSPNLGLIMVDGRCGDLAVGRTSPLSVVCASLSALLAQDRSFVVLDHYCGRHTRLESNNYSIGPRGLMNSLITQLLRYPGISPASLNFISQDLRDSLKANNPLALCQIFEGLLCQLGSGMTVFCIIDGVSDLETERQGWNNELHDIFRHLRDLIYNNRVPSLKLLVTSANQSRLFRQVKESDLISLTVRSPSNFSSTVQGITYGLRRAI